MSWFGNLFNTVTAPVRWIGNALGGGGGAAAPKPSVPSFNIPTPTKSPTAMGGSFAQGALQGAQQATQGVNNSGGMFDKIWSAVGQQAPNIMSAFTGQGQGGVPQMTMGQPAMQSMGAPQMPIMPGQSQAAQLPVAPPAMPGATAGPSAPGMQPKPVVKQRNWFDDIVKGATTGGRSNPAVIDENPKNVFEMFGQQVPGMAVSMLGDAMAPSVSAPDFSGQITDDIRKQIMGDVMSPEKRGALDKAMAEINADPGVPPEGAFTLGDIYSDEQLQDDLKAFDNAWKAARPGADIAGDSDYQRERQRIVERAMERRTAARDQQTFEYMQQQQARQAQYVQQVLNLDQSQMQMMIQLANLDARQLELEFGLSYAEAVQFKQLFMDLGRAITPGLGGV